MKDILQKKGIKCAIFDLDGTLLDSLGTWEEVDLKFLSDRGVVPDRDYVKAIAHLDFRRTAEYTIQKFNFSDTPDELMDEWRRLSVKAYEDDVLLKPFARQYLEYLKGRGVKLGISTSLMENLLVPCLKRNGVYHLFDAVTVAGGEIRGKEFPDVYLVTCNKLGCLPEQCAVFEDIAVGAKTARDAGFFSIGVRDEHCLDEELLKKSCDFYINCFDEIF